MNEYGLLGLVSTLLDMAEENLLKEGVAITEAGSSGVAITNA